MKIKAPLGCWKIGTRVRQAGTTFPTGRVVGYYSTETTDVGYCVLFGRSLVENFSAREIEFVETPDAQ